MNPSAIAAAATAAALALVSCPALAGPLEELAGGGTPDLVAAVAAIDPAAAPAWWLSGDGASHPVGCLLALAACSAVAAIVALASATPRREGDGGVLGDARVRSGRDAVHGSCTWDGRHDPKGRGLVYGYSGGGGRGRYLYEPGRFCLVDGSGKTRYMLIPTINLLTYGGASRGSEPHTIVVADVKGELLELTGDELARRGYEVLLLDAARPARGQRFNPLRQVLDLYSAGMPDEAEQAADGVAESLVPDDRDGAASHWVTSARSLLSAVVLLVCLDGSCPDGARTMGTVAAVACRGTEGEGDDPCAPLRSLLRSLPASHPARPRASQFLSSRGNELRSIVSTLKAAIRAYGSAPMAWLTSGSEVDPRRVLSRKTALFVRTMDEGSPYNALATVLLGQLWEAARLSAEAEGGRLARPVTVVGDEWGNLPRVPCLPAVLSLGRSYGFYWVGAVQNLAQLNRYDERDGRPKALANCGVKVALKLGEEERPEVLHGARGQDHPAHPRHLVGQGGLGHLGLDQLLGARRRRRARVGVDLHGAGPRRGRGGEAGRERRAALARRGDQGAPGRLRLHAHPGPLRPREPRARGGAQEGVPGAPGGRGRAGREGDGTGLAAGVAGGRRRRRGGGLGRPLPGLGGRG